MAAATFSIRKTTRAPLPAVPFLKIKEDILGKTYELSLVFVGDHKSRSLNHAYRKKSYVPNVLSFPIDKKHGEVFINPHQAKREAKKFGMTERGFIAYLYIHGLLHLVGHDHGDTMERIEARYVQRYKLK